MYRNCSMMYLYVLFQDNTVGKYRVKRFSDLSQQKSNFYYYEEQYDEKGKGKTIPRANIKCFELSPYPLQDWE